MQSQINFPVGPQEPLLATAKRRKLAWIGHAIRHDSLSKPSFMAHWREGDAVIGRRNAGLKTSKSGHPCCLQGPPAEKTDFPPIQWEFHVLVEEETSIRERVSPQLVLKTLLLELTPNPILRSFFVSVSLPLSDTHTHARRNTQVRTHTRTVSQESCWNIALNTFNENISMPSQL